MNKDILKTIYFARFDSLINYASIIWGQNINALILIFGDKTLIFFLLEKKAIRTINFEERHAHTNPLFHISDILKFLTSNYVHNKLPSVFNNWFTFSSNFHQHETFFTTKGHFKVPSVKTTFNEKVVITRNDIPRITKDVLLNSFSLSKLKLFLNMFF